MKGKEYKKEKQGEGETGEKRNIAGKNERKRNQ